MKEQELKILFKDDLAFLTEEVALDFKQVEISNLPVKFKAPAFLVIRVINYIENKHKLFVEVLSYHVGETEFSSNQIDLAHILFSIEKVTFKSINTFDLLRTQNSPLPIKILTPKPETVYRQEMTAFHTTVIQKEPIKETIFDSFSVPVKDITFLLGKVAFKNGYNASKN